MKPEDLKIGGRYNWRYQPERLTYMGTRHYPGDRRRWHQFALVEKPGVCWSEVLDGDLVSFEESAPSGGPAEPAAWLYESWVQDQGEGGDHRWEPQSSPYKPEESEWTRNIRPLYLRP
jgi:hypothetical protein